jgi:2-polyprenyl-3-methyl-5-hydroxy-6-metoxy-1,4-benzoquinol methylase
MKSHRFIPKTGIVDRIDALLDAAAGKDVLHIGMGGFVDDAKGTSRYAASDLSASVHGLLARRAADITGLDVNPAMLTAMQEKVPGNYVLADITEIGLAEKLGRKFDVVLFPEVVEHLDCFRTALSNIHGLLASDGLLVITTVNAFGVDSILKMLFRYEAVHEEHTCYFSYRTLTRLLDMNRFAIDDFSFCFEHRDRFSSVFERVSYHTARMIARVLPQYAEGLVIKARPI